MSCSLPLAKVDGLVVSHSGDELLVYDSETTRLHHLDVLTAEVWRHCDGVASLASAVGLIQPAVGSSVSITSVQLAIALLAERQLLATVPEPGMLPSEPCRAGRRAVLKAAARISIPAVVSVRAPLAVNAASGCANEGEQCSETQPIRSCCRANEQGVVLVCPRLVVQPRDLVQADFWCSVLGLSSMKR